MGLENLAAGSMRQLLAATDVAPVQVGKQEAISALEQDAEFLIQFFLGEELTYPVPSFHIDSFNLLKDPIIARVVLALPRGHSKTTLAKLAVIWFILFTNYRFIVYASNTAPIAGEALNDIVNFLESDNFRILFGPLEWVKRSDTQHLFKFYFNGRLIILRGIGAGQQMRGINVDNQRPQLAVVDDLEDDDNTATAALRTKVKQWFYGPFIKALDKKKNKVIYLGNMLSNESLLNQLVHSDGWHSRLFGCLRSDGSPLWPDMWPLEDIKADFLTYQKAGMLSRWYAEMMNMPMADGAGLISIDDITFKPPVYPGDSSIGFITIDPAISTRNSADKTAIVVHIFLDNQWQIAEYVHTVLNPLETYRAAISLSLKWGFRTIGIESVAYQASLQHFFKYMALQDGIHGLQIVGLTASARKTERLLAWCATLRNKTYTLTEGEVEITDQLANYNPAKVQNKDDLIDSCAYGVQMISLHLPLVMDALEGSPTQPLVRQGVDYMVV